MRTTEYKYTIIEEPSIPQSGGFAGNSETFLK
jgi:hypothetical protein